MPLTSTLTVSPRTSSPTRASSARTYVPAASAKNAGVSVSPLWIVVVEPAGRDTKLHEYVATFPGTVETVPARCAVSSHDTFPSGPASISVIAPVETMRTSLLSLFCASSVTTSRNQ